MKKEAIFNRQHYLRDKILTFIKEGEDPAYTIKEVSKGVNSAYGGARSELYVLRKLKKLDTLRLNKGVVFGLPSVIKKLKMEGK